jgi:hypothetical protein
MDPQPSDRPWTAEDWRELLETRYECDVACYEGLVALGLHPAPPVKYIHFEEREPNAVYIN